MFYLNFDVLFITLVVIFFEYFFFTKRRRYLTTVPYERWLRTKLMPSLPPNSVVVIDNASYHNRQLDAAPTSSTKKADMQTWLRQKEIQFEEYMLKPELYNLIKKYKDQHKKFNIDTILNEAGHSVLRLPPYHPDLKNVLKRRP